MHKLFCSWQSNQEHIKLISQVHCVKCIHGFDSYIYKHSLSTRLMCSDSVRFVKVLNVTAHRPHS